MKEDVSTRDEDVSTDTSRHHHLLSNIFNVGHEQGKAKEKAVEGGGGRTGKGSGGDEGRGGGGGSGIRPVDHVVHAAFSAHVQVRWNLEVSSWAIYMELCMF